MKYGNISEVYDINNRWYNSDGDIAAADDGDGNGDSGSDDDYGAGVDDSDVIINNVGNNNNGAYTNADNVNDNDQKL